jgi:signal transduction histidine kinase
MPSQVEVQPKPGISRVGGAKKGNIIVVDDNPNNLKLLEGMLRDSGYLVRLFPRGALALDAAQVHPPDLFLLDIMMPEMDGFEVCGQLKADQGLMDIPVIFLSALNETQDKVKAFSVGGIDYISKPFQIEEVRARIETHLELRRQKRLLQENYDRLQKLESLRDNLVHMIVHDMRSPLTVIHGVHELLMHLEGNNLSEQGAERLRGAMRKTEDLIAMVNSLLDVSKLEAGKVNLNLEYFDAIELIRKIADKSGEETSKHRFSTEIPDGELSIQADQGLISRVMQNLINNAVKYSSEGAEIRIGIEATDAAVRVYVQDQGPGIPPEFQERIFDKFFQLGNRRNSTGLGLTFCKLAVEAHGGSIGVNSTDGQGSRFWFILPVRRP